MNSSNPEGSRFIKFFAIFDGHGGLGCSEFLRDNLHNYIATSNAFPNKMEQAIKEGCADAESVWMRQNVESVKDKSGACAIICVLTETQIYVANVGDSRVILSQSNGRIIKALSTDHKPCLPSEKARIESVNGRVYQNQNVNVVDSFGNRIQPPWRVMPGRLSVSRSFGDCMAKFPKYGGIPGCVSAVPEIDVYPMVNENDYLMLGCDGIFD